MIHIVKSKKTGQFMVIVTGNNNEKLSTSELLKTKQSAIKNIRAQLKELNGDSCYVQDNTIKKIAVVRVYSYVSKHGETAMETKQAPQVK